MRTVAVAARVIKAAAIQCIRFSLRYRYRRLKYRPTRILRIQLARYTERYTPYVFTVYKYVTVLRLFVRLERWDQTEWILFFNVTACLESRTSLIALRDRGTVPGVFRTPLSAAVRRLGRHVSIFLEVFNKLLRHFSGRSSCGYDWQFLDHRLLDGTKGRRAAIGRGQTCSVAASRSDEFLPLWLTQPTLGS